MSIGGHSVSGIIDIKHNFHATAAPAVTDDITKEYDEGSQWVDETNNKSYVCVDNAAGAAVWQQTSGAGAVGLENVVEDTTPQLGGQLDVNGQALGDGTLELVKFVETASAVNEITITNAATNTSPQVGATGDDTNISLRLTPKGTGSIESPVPQNAQTGTTYTLVLSDYGKLVTMSNASAQILTIPTNASVAFPINTRLEVVMLGAGVTSVKGDTGVTLNGVSAGTGAINTQYQGVVLTKLDTNTWIASGDIGTVA